jgi:hypothetical protein
MATVVGTDPAAVKRITCRNCASVIEYTPSDTREIKETDYTGSTDIVVRLECPKCHASIAVDRR